MFGRVVLATALLFGALKSGPDAFAQIPAHNAAKFSEVFARMETIFGDRAAFQTAFEEARAEQARVEGALQLSLNLEARFRANGAAGPADIYRKLTDSLKPVVENLRTVFAKLDALDTPLDEARGRAAYDRISAEFAELYQRPMTEQYEYSKTHGLTEEPLKSVQTAAQTLIAIAERKPGQDFNPQPKLPSPPAAP